MIAGLASMLQVADLSLATAAATEPSFTPQPLAAELERVPQTVMNLIHAPQVQQELKLTDEKLKTLLPQLQQLDGPWWRARNLPASQRRRVTAEAEAKLFTSLDQTLGGDAVARLRQLELQAQGVRMLARPEIADYLRLTTDQRGKLDKLFAATDELAAKAATREGQSDSKATSAARAAKKAETEKGFQLLTSEQQRRLHLAVGSLLDTAKLERIYPLAPELIDSGSWSGSPAQLASLRGRVVLVHFYAFQCSNCQANFGIYNRWQKSLAPKGVELIGIQTPETAAERDVSKVLAAAKKDEFQFPVLIDLESANWNAWSNTMWPTVYVVDKQGYIRFWWQGELNWQGATADKTIEDLVARLLKE